MMTFSNRGVLRFTAVLIAMSMTVLAAVWARPSFSHVTTDALRVRYQLKGEGCMPSSFSVYYTTARDPEWSERQSIKGIPVREDRGAFSISLPSDLTGVRMDETFGSFVEKPKRLAACEMAFGEDGKLENHVFNVWSNPGLALSSVFSVPENGRRDVALAIDMLSFGIAVILLFAALYGFLVSWFVRSNPRGIAPREHNLWLDIYRIILIAMVVVLHASGNVYSNAESSPIAVHVSLALNALSRVAVPCFFMLSGYFLLGRKLEIGAFYFRRMLAILVPFLWWSLILSLWQQQALGVPLTGSLWGFVNGTGACYHLWFMYPLIGLYLLTPVLSRMCMAEMTRNAYLLLFALVFISSGLNTVDYMVSGVFSGFLRYLFPMTGPFAYYLMGYYLRCFHPPKWLCWTGFGLGTGLVYWGNLQWSVRVGSYETMFLNMTLFPVMLASVSFFALFLSFKPLSLSGCLSCFVSRLAKCSFRTYLLHPVVIYQLSVAYPNAFRRLTGLCLVVAAPVVSYAVAVIISLAKGEDDQ